MGELRPLRTTATWLLLGTAIAAEVAASLSLKGSASVPALYAVVVVGYVSSFVLLAQVLKRGMALGVAYGVWGAAGVAATAIASALIFDEALTAMMGVGLALIVVGVGLIHSGSPTTESPDPRTSSAAAQPVSEH